MRCIMSLESNGVKNPIGRVAFLWSPPSLHWRSSGANPYAGLLAEELAGHGVRVDARSDTNLRFVWTFPRSYDVIHFNWIPRLYEHRHPVVAMFRLLAFGFTLLWARVRGFRIVWTMHNVVPHEQLRPSYGLLARRILIALADVVICHCEYARQVLGRKFGRVERVEVIPHGSFAKAYPRDATKAEARRAFDMPNDVFVYGYFGNIRSYKGVEHLIDEFSTMEGGDLRLLIAGALHANYDGPLRSLTIDDPRVITHLRHIADEEVQLVMAAVDVLVLPFVDTLTSGSAVLALGYGTPIVMPCLGCLPELVGTGAAAISYDPDDPTGLQRALKEARVIDIDAARTAALERDRLLNWSMIANRTLAAYGFTKMDYES